MKCIHAFLVVLLMQVPAGVAQAQTRLTVPLDGSFQFFVSGQKTGKVSVDNAATAVFFKVMTHKGRTYVCGAFKTQYPYLRNFLDQSRLVAQDGTIMRRDLGYFTDVTYKVTSAEVDALVKSKDWRVHNAQLRKLRFEKNRFGDLQGKPVKCRRSAKAWQPDFATSVYRLDLPDRVSITRLE
ncbi:hypothetical protein [Ascidiaceihabitans sp.]|uniref:hypothetical protein n=1 Tax=Ascidiaceihabitans sp. TaxID=1872644 RepID=UPI003297985D